MRISIVTDEISQDLAACEVFLREHDLHAVELRCIGGRRVPELAAAEREVLRGWARGGDPHLVALSPGLFKCAAEDRAEIRRQLEEVLPRSLDLALDLGVENLICFGFEASGAGAFPGAAIDALSSAAQSCCEAGLALLLENEPGFLASSAARTCELIRAVDHQALFANWDPTNSNEFAAEQLGRAAQALAPWLRNVHVKNGHRAPGELLARCGPLRAGAIDWPAHLAQLQGVGYEGYLAIETHFEPLPASSAALVGELRAMLAALDLGGDEGEDDGD